MKKIIRIARTELSIMFYSPIAWLVIILFFIQSGLVFTDLLYSQETNQQLERPLSVLSKVLFAGEDGILAKIQQYLYLYIPILTMGLFSREQSSGSIKLLLSSPVTAVQMVLGKFGAMMGYSLILVFILSSFIFTANIAIIELDIPFVLGGILGIYLLMCAYSAIGLFMSSLTSYQIVAVISTLAILAGLNYIGSVGQHHDTIREITYWLSISGRANNFVNGLISSGDIIYFLLVIILFLSFTILKYLNSRSSASVLKKFSGYIIVTVTIVLIGFLSSLPGINTYYDTTRFKDRTLTTNSQELIDRLEEPIDITTYVNVIHYSAEKGSPKNRIDDLKHFEMYRRFIPQMDMKYIYYYDSVPYRDTTLTLKEKAIKSANALKFDFEDVLNPEEIRSKRDLQSENNRLVRFISYRGDTTALRMFDDIFQYPGEAEISAGIKRLLDEPARIGFVTNHGERNIKKTDDASYKIITNGKNIRGSLINQGFETETVDLLKEVPDNYEVLVIADPTTKLDSIELKHLTDYIETGGDMLITTESKNREYINPLLKNIGLELTKGTILQESEDHQLDLVQAKFTNQASKYRLGFYSDAVVGMPNATGLKTIGDSEFMIEPLLRAEKNITWKERDTFDLEKETPVFDSLTDSRQTYPLGVGLTRELNGKTQKIMVFGDADFMSNAEITRNNLNNVNSSTVIRMFKYFTNGEYPISTGRPKAIDTKINISRSNIVFLKFLYGLILPLLIASLAGVILIRRKRK